MLNIFFRDNVFLYIDNIFHSEINIIINVIKVIFLAINFIICKKILKYDIILGGTVDFFFLIFTILGGNVDFFFLIFFAFVFKFYVSLDDLALDGSLAFGLLAVGAWPTSKKSKAESFESDLWFFLECRDIHS